MRETIEELDPRWLVLVILLGLLAFLFIGAIYQWSHEKPEPKSRDYKIHSQFGALEHIQWRLDQIEAKLDRLIPTEKQ